MERKSYHVIYPRKFCSGQPARAGRIPSIVIISTFVILIQEDLRLNSGFPLMRECNFFSDFSDLDSGMISIYVCG